MASVAAVPRINQTALAHSTRMRNLPAIPHPATRLGDRSKLHVIGSASLATGRPQTVAGYPSMAVATCFSWSDVEFPSASTKKRRYKKRAMATRSKSDERILETVTERLVDGFQAMRNLFKENDPDGGEAVTQESLKRIMVIVLGFIDKPCFDRMLLNLGLEKRQKIPFDLFVSRFKEFKDIQRQWTAPVRREVLEDTQSRAHPEEHLRDCEPYAWAQLRTAPQASFLLKKAIREKGIDFRSILPDECFLPNGVVTKIQLRTSLQELGVNLTDQEYKRFWERYDHEMAGFIPLETFYARLDMTREGEPDKPPVRTVRTPVMLRANTGLPPRNPAQAAREFALRRHKIRGEDGPPEGIRGEAILSPTCAGLVDASDPIGDEGEGDGKESPTADSAARSRIRAVLNQKRQGKFDCIIDCLNYKFEERYNNLMMAFKLFDIYDNGSVMRIDMRRVLTEFGMPVAAIQLGPLMHRLGVLISYGLITYTEMLAKLMNRKAAFTSQILDDKIQASSVQEGGTADAALSDTDEEAIARRLVELLHQDYIKLAVALLRSDRANKGVVPLEDLKSAVERCLGYSMTESQWRDFQTKIPYDAEGNVRYVDFMVSFNHGDPGAWNRVKAGAVSVPKNKVVNTPSEEVRRLEKNKTGSDPVKLPVYEHRPVAVLRKELQEFFRDHLHDVDKRFKEIDRKSHKRFSKWQFGALLKLCGFPMTDKELTDVWLSIKLSDDNMSTFNNVVMEFAPGFYTFRTAAGETAVEENGEEQAGDAAEDAPYQAPVVQRALIPNGTWPDQRTISPETEARAFLAHVMAKAAPGVKKNWESLRQGFRNYDPHGFGSVTFNQMQRLVDSMHCGLTKLERDQLCAQFDFKAIGRPNYLAFMKAFAERGPHEKFVYSPRYHYLEKKRRRIKQPVSQKLIKHWKNLRRGFQKHDRSRTGSLSVLDFKRVLKECEVPVSEEDLYHILTEFDSNMNGLISYSEFLDVLLRAG